MAQAWRNLPPYPRAPEPAPGPRTIEDYEAYRRNLPPYPRSIYKFDMDEKSLVQRYQQDQGTTRFCASYAIATALNMLYDTHIQGSDVAAFIAHQQKQMLAYPLFSWLPDGSAILPYQQVRIINHFSSQILGRTDHLPIAQAKNLSTEEMIDALRRDDTAVLMTYNVDRGKVLSGHVVVLAAYDPTKGFGFLNSGADAPEPNPETKKVDSLTWKTIQEIGELLADPIALEVGKWNPNFVVITRP